MSKLFKYNLIYLAIFSFNILLAHPLKTKKNKSKKVIAKSLLSSNKILKYTSSNKNNQGRKLGILEFIERRFGVNPAAAVLRPPIAAPLRRF